MKSLGDISSFGGIDADADDLLDACFQDHEAYRQAVAHERFLIVGRKGSGKTAIFKKIIQEQSPTVFSFGHTFADYPWNHHQLQATLGVPEEQRYIHSWQYLILLTMAKVLLNMDTSQPWNAQSRDGLKKLESFVVDSYGSRDPDVTQLFTPGKRLRIKPHLKIADAVQIGVDLERLPVADLPKVFQEVTRTITDAVIECINPEMDYYVCFDELDRGFDPSSPQYSQMLVGLILAAKRINEQARAAGKRLSVIVFLRDDIYQLLKFEDKNKITENHTSVIEWDTRNTDWTLRQLMERRFSAVLADGDPLPWSDVFDETKEMPGRQSKYQHVLDRTLQRPRDIIKFCNEILSAYKKRSGDKGNEFKNEDIINARPAYSDYLLNELDDEIHKHLPRYEGYLEIIKTVGALQFTKEEFEQACKRRAELIPENTRPLDLLRELFEFSVVAYQRTGGVGGGSAYMWRYQDPRVRFDEAATNFRVHPGFMEALGLKKFRVGK